MRLFLSTLVILCLSLTSCKKELEPQENSDVVAPVPATPTSTVPATPTSPAVSTQQTTVAPVAPALTAKGMNPAHGQPGHRCDISVGAPLNSPPGKAAPQTAPAVTQNSNASVKMTPAVDGTLQPKPTTTSGTPAILNAPTAPGMNPPHGQDGHRCDVAVGAPLPK